MPKKHNKSKRHAAHKGRKITLPKSAGALIPKVKGSGGYLTDLIEKGLGAIGHIFGIGDYEVKANTLFHGSSSTMQNGQIPEFPMPVIRIKHREFLGNVFSTVDFSSTKYPINPGLYQTFPWLSGLAPHFTTYRIHGMVFAFCSRSATAIGSTSTALGSVIMTTQYEATEPEFVDQKAMESYKYTTAGKPSDSFLHPVECDFSLSGNVTDKMYVRTGAPPDTKLLYDKGFLQVATVGMQAADQNLGELWVAYDVELFMPALPPSGSLSPITGFHTVQTTSATNNPLTNYDPNIFCNINQLHCEIDLVDKTLTIPKAGTYLVLYGVNYNGGTSGDRNRDWTIPAGASGTFFTIDGGNPVNYSYAIPANATPSWMAQCITTTLPDSVITFTNFAGNTGTATSVDVRFYIVAMPTLPSPLSYRNVTVDSLNSRIAMLEEALSAKLNITIPSHTFAPIDIYETKTDPSKIDEAMLDLWLHKCKLMPNKHQATYARDLLAYFTKNRVKAALVDSFKAKFSMYFAPAPTSETEKCVLV